MKRYGKILKSVISMILSVGMVLCPMGGYLSETGNMTVAYGWKYDSNDEFEYIISDDSNVEIKGYKGSETEVVIPEKIDGYDVISIGNYAFSWNNIKSISLPDSITVIGNGAFYCCEGLESVALPNSIISIGDKAFYGCINLDINTLPDSVTNIGYYAFWGCSITNIVLPDSITHIGENAFDFCFSGKSCTISVDSNNKVYDSRNDCNAIIKSESNELIYGCANTQIPDSVTRIKDYAFKSCSGLERIIIPDSVTSIGTDAFCGCNNLKSIIIPDSVTNIDDNTFYGCSNLESVIIPDSVTRIGKLAFYDCENLSDIKLPDSITTIEKSAFSGCNNLKNIEIPGSVSEIGSYAFSHTGLESITFKDEPDMSIMKMIQKYEPQIIASTPLLNNVTESWYMSEKGVDGYSSDGKSLTSLIGRIVARKLIESGEVSTLKDAYDWLCRNCGYKLKAGDHYSYADGPFFYGIASCNGVALAMKCFLDELGYPNFRMTGTVVGAYGQLSHSFMMVKDPTQGWRIIDPTDTSYGDYSAYMITLYKASSSYNWDWDDDVLNTGLEKAVNEYEERTLSDNPLTYSLNDDGTYTITDCESGAINIEIPSMYDGKRVSAIGDAAFKNCYWLESVVIPEGIATIGSEAFGYCIGLKEIKLPKSISYIGDRAFCKCVSLEKADLISVNINSLQGSFNSIFYGCVGLNQLLLSPNIDNIDFPITSCSEYYNLINRTSGECRYNIIGYEGSAVERYAIEHGNHFTSVGKVQNIEGVEEKYTIPIDEGTLSLNAFASGEGKLTYESNDSSIVTIDNNGIITPVSTGETTVTIFASEKDEYLAAKKIVHIVVTDPVEYKIFYDLDGGKLKEGESNPSIYTFSGDNIVIKNPTRLGYDFEGWIDSEGMNLTQNLVIFKGTKGNLKYTAKWTPRTYKINLITNGGIINSGNVETFTYGTETILPTDVTKDNYTFVGWYDESHNRFTALKKIYDVEAHDITLYAVWKKIPEKESSTQNETITTSQDSGTIQMQDTTKDKTTTTQYEETTIYDETQTTKEVPTTSETQTTKESSTASTTDWDDNYDDDWEDWEDDDWEDDDWEDDDWEDEEETEPVSTTERISLSKCKITLSESRYNYDGKAKKPKVTIKYGNATLKSGSDYTLKYKNNKNAGKASVLIQAVRYGKYVGEVEKTFTINKINPILKVGKKHVKLDIKNSKFKVSLTTNTDGKITYSSSNSNIAAVNKAGLIKPKKAGTCTITVNASEGKNYYSQKTTFTVNITKLKEQSIKCKSRITKTYGDSDFNLGIHLKDNPKITYITGDSTIAKVNNNGDVKIVGSGKTKIYIYVKGTKKYYPINKAITINVTKASIKNVKVKLRKEGDIEWGTFDEDKDIEVTYKGRKLKNGKDYYVGSMRGAASNNIYTYIRVQLNGRGNYTGIKQFVLIKK